MPEEMEVPLESSHDAIHEEAEKTRDRWTLVVAMCTAILAVFAAITSLMAGHHANEAMIDQLQASDQWSFYQAKGIKAAVLQNKIDLLHGMGKEPVAGDGEKLQRYAEEQKSIEETAHEHEHASADHLRIHQMLAKSVTAFQIAIAIAAISVLTRRKWLFTGSLFLGCGGLGLLILALL